MLLHTKYKGYWHFASGHEDFLYSLYKPLCDPRGVLHYVMLYTKYQGAMPCGSRQEDFFYFPHISERDICDSRQNHF